MRNAHSNFMLLQTVKLFLIKIVFVINFMFINFKLLRNIALNKNLIKICYLGFFLTHIVLRRVYMVLQNVHGFRC